MKNQMGKIQSGVLTGVVLAVAIGAGVVAFFLFDASGTKKTLGPEYTYDITQYAKIDPSLILYQQTGKFIQTDFQITHAIALDGDGNIYVAGDSKVAQYDSAGKLLKTIELPKEPTCIEIDLDGNLIVGMSNVIVILDSQGNTIQEWTAPTAVSLQTSIAVDKDHIFAADALNKLVWCYDRAGNVIEKIGQKDADRNIPGIVVPSPYFDIAMYPDGLLRVVNPGRHWIEAYTTDGHREWHWGRAGIDIEGFSGCCNPVALAVLPDGGFVTAEKGLVRVKIYDADGEFVGVVAGPDQLGWIEPLRVCETPEECKAKGFDVAVDKAGRIYVLDTLRNVVRIFERNKSAAARAAR
jgi:outer membrane protein assembly factor BamB